MIYLLNALLAAALLAMTFTLLIAVAIVVAGCWLIIDTVVYIRRHRRLHTGNALLQPENELLRAEPVIFSIPKYLRSRRE